MYAPQIAPKFYIKGKHALQRAKNLEKIAREEYKGNFSEMVNDALNKAFGLDPVTGEKVRSCPTGAPKPTSTDMSRNVNKRS